MANKPTKAESAATLAAALASIRAKKGGGTAKKAGKGRSRGFRSGGS